MVNANEKIYCVYLHTAKKILCGWIFLCAIWVKANVNNIPACVNGFIGQRVIYKQSSLLIMGYVLKIYTLLNLKIYIEHKRLFQSNVE